MKKEKGITLVSLVVTIIILIILAGVSINLTLGKNGIITIAKQAKENTELAKIEEETGLNELYMQIEAEGGTTGDISYDAIAKLTEFKTAIADYIEEAGGVKPEETADAATFRESIKGIVKEATKDATATADNITQGKTAYVNGIQITGNGNDINSSKQEVCNKVYNALKENEVSPSSSSLEDILTAISTIKNGSGSGVVTVSGTATAVINMNTGRTYCQTSSTFTVNININDGEITYSVDGGNATASSWVDISDLYGSILCTEITGVSIKSVTYSEA